MKRWPPPPEAPAPPSLPPAAVEGRALWIILGFALLMAAVFTTYRLYTPWNLSHDLIYLGTFEAKAADPGLFPRDWTFHDDAFFSHYLPVFRHLLAFLRQLTGSFEGGLWLLVPLLVFSYALGWGLLLWRLHHSLWIALFFTFLAIPYRPAPLGEVWGVAGIEGMVARTLVTAPAPYLFLLIFSWLQEPRYWKALLVGTLTGLSVLIYPLTPLFFLELGAGLFILGHGRRTSTWGMLGLMVVVFGLLAWYPGTLREQQVWPQAAGVTFEEFRHVVQQVFKIPEPWYSWRQNTMIRYLLLLLGVWGFWSGRYVLAKPEEKPRLALQVWLWGGLAVLYICWRLAGKGAGLSWLYATMAAYVVWASVQGEVEQQDWWLLAWGLVTLFIYLVPSLLLIGLWVNLEQVSLTSFVVEYRRVTRLIHPFSYLLAARAAARLLPWLAQVLSRPRWVLQGEYSLITLAMCHRPWFWLTLAAAGVYEGGRRWSPRLALAALGLLVLASLTAAALRPALILPRLNELLAPLPTFATFPADYLEAEKELAAWAREHTPKDALFYHQSAFFRYQARRSITHGHPTWGETGNYRTTNMVNFYRRSLQLNAAYGDPQTLLQEAATLGADYLVVAREKNLRLDLPVVFANNKFIVYRCRP
jgi:hypothetical protein